MVSDDEGQRMEYGYGDESSEAEEFTDDALCLAECLGEAIEKNEIPFPWDEVRIIARTTQGREVTCTLYCVGRDLYAVVEETCTIMWVGVQDAERLDSKWESYDELRNQVPF